jgi:hypothetical protein
MRDLKDKLKQLFLTRCFLSKVKTHDCLTSLEDGGKANESKTSLQKDLGTIIFLIYMYFLQTIPFGMDRSMPLVLSGKNASYDAQGTFGLSYLPYSLKILWYMTIHLFVIFLNRDKMELEFQGSDCRFVLS